MSGYTPGPWSVGGGCRATGFTVKIASGELLVGGAGLTSEANARLIAAAPELLEALEKAEEHLAAIGTPRDAQGRYHKDGEWTFGEALPRDVDAREVSAAFTVVRAAIAKAKGEPHA